MRKNPIEAYETAGMGGMSPRELEAAALTKAAVRLKECRDDWRAEGRKERLLSALKFNQRVWSFFQAALSKEDNPLPDQLKVNILQLSAFVDRRIFEIMADPENPEKLNMIIDINLNIAAGLREKTE